MSGAKTALLIGGGLVVGYLVVRKLTPPPAIPNPNRSVNQSSTVSLGGLIGAGASALGSFFGAKSSAVSVTDRSNALADATAASDTLTGMVGFGGWDANSLADHFAAEDTATGVVGFGGWD